MYIIFILFIQNKRFFLDKKQRCKNFVFVILIIAFVGSILFGSLVRRHYLGGTKFKNLQKVAIFFAEIPYNIKFIITNFTLTGDVITPISEQTYDDKKFFDKKGPNMP